MQLNKTNGGKMVNKKTFWGRIFLVLVCLGVTLLVTPSVYAASTLKSAGFGEPVNDKMEKLDCKPGDKDCAAVGYKCYKGAKREYYVNTSSECSVEKDEVAADGSKKSVMWYLNKVINVVLGVIGVVAVAMIIIGGIQYATSSGDAAKAQKAQKTIIFSVVGLIIALLAFAIVNFVLTSVFGK